MKIGVVTPTHPARNFNHLPRACQSVWEQTYPVAGHIIVNDAERLGASRTRDTALRANPFEWTAFLDSDDWFAPHHLQTLVEAAEETGADYVYSWYWLMNGDRSYGDFDPVFPSTHFTEPWNPADPRQTTITVLVRTDLAIQAGGFWEPQDEQRFPDGHRIGEDWLFTLKCNELGKIHHVVERTWYWNHHGFNTSGRPGYGDA